jgi:hypothetical protein
VPVELWAVGNQTRAPPDRARPTGVTTGCAILQARAELPSRKRKAGTMTSTPETIPTSQENPEQPSRWAFMRDISTSLFHEAIPSVIRGLGYFCLDLIGISIKACFIFLFVNFCALSILFMGDYIFCNSAHAERFTTIANIVASHMSVQGVLSFIVLYGTASHFRKARTDFDTVAAINIGQTQPHTQD